MFDGVSKWKLLCAAVFTLLPMYSWYRFFKIWSKLEENLQNTKLFYQRHNCVVTYARNRTPAGWPKLNATQPSNGFARTELYESILYFIHTSNKSIDIAMMLISVKVITDALVEARKRNVAIRIILDYEYNKRKDFQDLHNAGIEIAYYVCPDTDLCSIMHYKYMVKDYDDGKGFVYLGSLNWTGSGMQGNYENTVFTSNGHVAKTFHENFEETWDFVNDLSQNNYYVKAKLSGIQ